MRSPAQYDQIMRDAVRLVQLESLTRSGATIAKEARDGLERNAELYKANVNLREKLQAANKELEVLRANNKRLLRRGPSLGSRITHGGGKGKTKAQEELDRLAWTILDSAPGLSLPGGWYRVDDLTDDICAHFPQYTTSDLEISQKDAMETILLWCKNRTSWWGDRRFWLQVVSIPERDIMVIKRSRFLEHLARAPKHAHESRKTRISERGSRVIIQKAQRYKLQRRILSE